MGTECHYFICDVGNREEVYQTAKAVREKARGDCLGLGTAFLGGSVGNFLLELDHATCLCGCLCVWGVHVWLVCLCILCFCV